MKEVFRRYLNTGHGPINGGERPHITMTMSFQDLVLGSAAEVLDIGQATRIWPAAIRRAITLRDKGCAWYSGDRPPAWCDVHHLVPVTGRADR